MSTDTLGSDPLIYLPGDEPSVEPGGTRGRAALAWLLVAAGALMLLAVVGMAFARRGIPLPALRDSKSWDRGEPWYSGVFNALGTAVLLATGGYLALRLPRKPLTWLMLVAGFANALNLFAIAYTYTSYLVTPQPLPLTAAMFVLAAVGLALWLSTIPMIILLFPSGQLPSPRWRFTYAVWLYVVVAIGGLTWLTPSGKWVPFDNPVALEGQIGELLARLTSTSWYVWLLLLILAIISAVGRGRRARGLERQQFRWLVFAGLWITFGLVFVNVANIRSVWGYLANMLAISAIPLAVVVAVARYRLWDLDVLIRRTTSYALLTALLAAVYFGSVVVLQQLFARISGENSTPAIVLSTLLIAALFLPLRRRVQDVIDRRFFRRKYDAEKVLAQFAATARDETDLDALTAELVRIIQETMQPEQVSIWLRPTTEVNARTSGR